VLESLGGEQPALADSIRRHMFAFDDIAVMPSERLKLILARVESEELAVALRTASEKIKKKIFDSLSASAARRLRQQMEMIGPVRLSDVEAAQQRVVEAVRLFQQGVFVSQQTQSRAGIIA